MVEPASFGGGPVESLLERGPIFGMNPLYECRIGWRCRRIEGKDAEMLCRPGDLARAGLPAPTAGLADLLRIGERGAQQVILHRAPLGMHHSDCFGGHGTWFTISGSHVT